MHLFNEYEAYTDDANEIDTRVTEAIFPIIQYYKLQGYALREIEQVVTHAVTGMMCEEILRATMAKRKIERSK